MSKGDIPCIHCNGFGTNNTEATIKITSVKQCDGTHSRYKIRHGNSQAWAVIIDPSKAKTRTMQLAILADALVEYAVYLGEGK